MAKSIKDQFISFLKKHRAYAGFMRELKRDRGYDSLDEHILGKERSGEDFISSAFSWSSTEKCKGYWSGINAKWQAHLKGEE